MSLSKIRKVKKTLPKPNKKSLGITYQGVSLTNVKMNANGEWTYKFRSRIWNDGQQEHLGTFNTELEAAQMYNKRAKALYKEKGAKARNKWNYL